MKPPDAAGRIQRALDGITIDIFNDFDKVIAGAEALITDGLDDKALHEALVILNAGLQAARAKNPIPLGLDKFEHAVGS
jgi:hypothetical protein